MPEIQDLNTKCEALGWGGDGPKTLVQILSERPSWREDSLEKEYYKRTNPTFITGHSNFRTLAVQMLEHCLIKEKAGKTGYRFQLNKKIWEQEAKAFRAIRVVADFYNENPENRLRANCTLRTFIKRIEEKLSDTPYGDLPPNGSRPIAGTIASKLRDFSNDESLKRFRCAVRKPAQIKNASPHTTPAPQPDLFKGKKNAPHQNKTQLRQSAAPQKTAPEPKITLEPKAANPASLAPAETPPETGHISDTPAGLPNGCVKLLEPVDFWRPVIEQTSSEMLRMEPFADRHALITQFNVSATRRQSVMLAVMKKKVNYYFLAFSLCGLVSDDIDIAKLLADVNIEPNGFHPAILKIDNEQFVSVVQVLPLTAEQTFYESITSIGKMADHLEDSFWHADEH